MQTSLLMWLLAGNLCCLSKKPKCASEEAES